jgi:WD40 repeat protein
MVVDPHLVSTIVEDVHNQPGALPLLQYALTEIYARRQGNHLTLDEYHAIGGVSGALAQRASEIYSTLNAEDSELTRQAFLRMITINEDGTATRRRIDWTELQLGIQHPDKLNAVINAFSRYRLLTSDRDPVTRTPTLEIAHEALIAAWAQLKIWIEQNRFDLQKRQLLRLAVDEWKNSRRDRSYLAIGARLAEFETLLNHPIISLNPEELAYIESSVQQRENAARRTRFIIATLAISTVVTLILAVLAFTSQQRAEEARTIALQERDRANITAQVARSRELAASALSNGGRHDLALLLAVEAARTAPTYEAMNSLLTSLQTDPFIERYLYGHTDWVRSVSYNSDGSVLVSGGGDGSIIRWSPADGSPIGDPIAAHDGAVTAVAVSADDRLIASVGTDGIARLWDAADGVLLAELDEAQAELWSVALSPDASLLATGAASGEILVWNIETRAIAYRIPAAHSDIVYHVAFNPAGTRLASGGGDNLVRVWDASNGTPVGEPFSGHTNWVLTLAFSPDNAVLLSSGADARVLVWDYETGEILGELATGHRNWVRDIELNDDGQIVATASLDGTIRVWNLQSGQQIVPPLTAHTDAIWSIDFAPGELRIASGSADQRVLLWHLILPQRPGSLVINAGQSINAFAISEQSRRYAATGDGSGGGSSNLIVWDANADTILHTLPQRAGQQVLRIAMSPDGSLLASATTDSTITLWDMDTGTIHGTILSHDGLVVSGLVFTPDNQQLISVDESGKVVRTSVSTAVQIPTAILGSDSGVTSLAISPDGLLLAIGGRDATVAVWNLASETLVLQPSIIHEDAVITLAFNHAGTRLLSGGRDNQIVVWDLTTGQAQRETLTGHTDWILSLAVSPDDALFASAGRDNTIRLWDFENLRPIGTPFIGHQDWINGLFFIADRTLLASSRNGAVIEWSVDFNTWVSQACSISNRSMTPGEWQQFMSEQDYRATCTPSG